MKIGILAGRVPPPVFINQLVCGLAEAGHKVFLYGSSHDKNFQYNNPLLFVRTKPKYKIPLFFNSFRINESFEGFLFGDLSELISIISLSDNLLSPQI